MDTLLGITILSHTCLLWTSILEDQAMQATLCVNSSISNICTAFSVAHSWKILFDRGMTSFTSLAASFIRGKMGLEWKKFCCTSSGSHSYGILNL